MINCKIDSRKVEKGDIFVAIKGYTVDGHDFVNKAVEKGAAKVVLQKDMDIKGAEKIVVNDSSAWLNEYVVNNYKNEVNSLKLIGITGTSGKTTTAFLTYSLLNSLNYKTAYIGTIGFFIPGLKKQELPNTTPNILDLYEMLLEAKESGCICVVMEVSSHALAQKRVEGLNFYAGGFTNLSQDHLDYHKDMTDYLNAKKLILNQVVGDFFVNIDDSYGQSFCESYKNCKTFGYNASDYKIISYEDSLYGTNIYFTYENKNYIVQTNLKSSFNVYNFLMALSLVHTLGFEIDDIIKNSLLVYAPKGRCEQVSINGGLAVVDYAHKPDAVLKVIKAFSENKKGKVYTLIGCGGDRDSTKRPIMGKIASDNSDYVIFTNDNPRTEDPKKIMDDILKGVSKDNYEVILDRKDAIKKIISLIKKEDVALILGKGHENYQIIGHEKIHLDDLEEVMKIKNGC